MQPRKTKGVRSMARLPDPVVDEIDVTWEEGYVSLEKSIFSQLGNLVRIAEAKEREMEGEKGES